MREQLTGLKVASAVFALLALLQLIRLLLHFDIAVAGHLLPFWPSFVAVIVLGGLSIWMWKLGHKAIGLRSHDLNRPGQGLIWTFNSGTEQ